MHLKEWPGPPAKPVCSYRPLQPSRRGPSNLSLPLPPNSSLLLGHASTGMGLYKRKKEKKSEQESIQARVNDKKNVLKKI